MNYNLSSFFGVSQDIIMIVLFISIVLFVLMIYVGICIIKIKNDVKELTDLEFKKYKESHKEMGTSEKIDNDNKTQKDETLAIENTTNANKII